MEQWAPKGPAGDVRKWLAKKVLLRRPVPKVGDGKIEAVSGQPTRPHTFTHQATQGFSDDFYSTI